MPNREILSWEAEEFDHKPRTIDWYWIVGGLTVVSAGLAFYFGNILFAAVLILCGTTLSLHAGSAPKMHRYSIHEEGLAKNDFLYPYRNIKTFWVLEERGKNTLLLDIDRIIMPVITIPLGPIGPASVRELLREKKIKEDVLHIPLAEQIMDSVGF